MVQFVRGHSLIAGHSGCLSNQTVKQKSLLNLNLKTTKLSRVLLDNSNARDKYMLILYIIQMTL